MARLRGSAVQSFMQGWQAGKSLVGDFQKAKDSADMRKIAKETPEMSEGFTAEQGDELRRAAESGQYDIGYDEARNAYTVTPKADPSQVGMIAQQGVTDFMGERSAGTMSSEQVDNARQRAMAGVVERSDPVAANRMRRELKTAEREDKRFGWEEARAERETKKNAEADAADAYKKQLEQETGDFMKSRLVDAEGNTRPATVDDYLASTQFKAAKLIESGKTDAAGDLLKDYAAQSFVKIQLETAERDQALGKTVAAVNAGNLDAARQFYDRYLPDGATVSEFKQGPDGRIVAQRMTDGGQPMEPLVFKDVNQLTASLSVLKDPMAVYNWSNNEFKNSLSLRAERRADNADARAARSEARAAANAGSSRADAAAKTAAAVNLFKEKNPGASNAEIEAVRLGVMSALPKKSDGYKVEAGDVATLLGTPAVDDSGKPLMDPMTGRQVVNRDAARERQFFEFMEANGITSTDEGLAKFLAPKQGRGGSSKSAGGGQKAIAKGQVVDGYEFLGGDPNSQKSWRQVASGKVK